MFSNCRIVMMDVLHNTGLGFAYEYVLIGVCAVKSMDVLFLLPR